MLIGWAAIDSLKQEFPNVGKILGNEEKAQRLVDYWNDTMSALAEKVAQVPAAERKKVYYLSGADVTKANTGDWGRTWIETIGADFAVPETDLNGDVTVEKALEWDPDVIVVQGGNDLNERIRGRADTGDEGHQEQAGVLVPHRRLLGGTVPAPRQRWDFCGWRRRCIPTTCRTSIWKPETKAFFKEFYGYELSGEECRSFFE